MAREKVPLEERKCHVVQDQEDTGEIETPAVQRSSTWLVAPAGGQKNFLKWNAFVAVVIVLLLVVRSMQEGLHSSTSGMSWLISSGMVSRLDVT